MNINYLYMKKIMMIMVLGALMAYLVPATAQTFSSSRPDLGTSQSQQIMNGGAYDGTVYEPFSNTTPSEQSEVGAQYSPSRGSGPRKDFINPNNPGNQSNESPLGDAVWPLLAFALVFCGVIALRRKRETR